MEQKLHAEKTKKKLEQAAQSGSIIRIVPYGLIIHKFNIEIAYLVLGVPTIC